MNSLIETVNEVKIELTLPPLVKNFIFQKISMVWDFKGQLKGSSVLCFGNDQNDTYYPSKKPEVDSPRNITNVHAI